MTIRSIHDLAAAVRGRRTDLGMSQAQLAERAGVSRKWIYEFEAAKPAAEFGLLLRVLDALDLTLELVTTTTRTGDTIDLDVLLEVHRGS